MEADRGELCFGDVLSLEDFIISNVQTGRQIGSGAHGRILEARWEGTVVAIKETHAIFTEASEIEFHSLKRNFLQECEQSSRLRHPNIMVAEKGQAAAAWAEAKSRFGQSKSRSGLL